MPQNTLTPSITMTPVSRHQRLIAFIAIVLCVIFAFTFKARLDRLRLLNAEIQMWDQRISEAKSQQAALYENLQYVKSDEYVEAVAREELGLTLPEDQLIVIVNDPNNAGLVNLSTNISIEPSALSRAGKTDISVKESTSAQIWEQWVALFLEPNQSEQEAMR